MTRRWALALALLLVAVMAATLPLRLALAGSDAAAAGLSARGVTGSIWSGRLTDAAWRGAALGSIDAGLSPLALLGGEARLKFQRDDALRGPLSGAVILSGGQGIADVSGAASLGAALGGVPLDTLRLDGVTARFDAAGACAEASGTLALSLAIPVPGLDLANGLTGPLACRDGRAEAALASQSGRERLTLSVDGKGAWRARLSVAAGSDPALAAILRGIGFAPAGDALVLVQSGQW
jgi:general secretion pathway protein N